VITKVAHLAERSVRYLEAGEGPPIVLLHAFPLSAEQWLPQLLRVPPGWRVVAPDQRGFRGSGPAFEDPGVEGVTMEGYATDVLALMDHLDIQRAVVAGLSMGGYVAFAMLRLAAARVAGLVLANTRASTDSAEGRASRDRLIALVRQDGPVAIAREMLPKLLGETTRREQPDLVEAIDRLIRMNSADGLAAALAAMRDRPDSTSLLPTIACPTTIITGDEDTAVPAAESEAMHRLIPGSRLVVLPKVGHLSNLGDGGFFHRLPI
jgi:pimeloyl-ACP methyl ester carboxylesterase